MSVAYFHKTTNPDPVRTTVRSVRLVGNYEVERDQNGVLFQENWTKRGLLAAGELGESKVVRSSGGGVTAKTEIDPTNHVIVEKRFSAGVANPDIWESRSGTMMRETRGGEGTVLTRTIVDALGRPEYETLAPQGRTTVYQYDYATGGVSSTNTSATGGALAVSQTYHPASDAAFGRVKTRTEAGLTTNYRYSARGELVGTWGATYPVRYSYDAAGRLVKMETYRQNSSGAGTYPVAQWNAGDGTQWVYHAGTMALQQKLDAAGKGALYTYDPKGSLGTREWARVKAGSTTVKVAATYTHNGLGELAGISYNDGTTAGVTLGRDGSGRMVTIHDGTGARTFGYNGAGLLEEEALGTWAKLGRVYDAFGRADAVTLTAEPNGAGTGCGESGVGAAKAGSAL